MEGTYREGAYFEEDWTEGQRDDGMANMAFRDMLGLGWG
jgi:hypothetical protein